MIRYARLYLHFVRFSISKALEFRIDFSFRILMDTVFYTTNILFYKIIYDHTGILGGWSEDQVMVFVAGYLLVDALIMTFVSANLWWLPMLVNRGDLDYYLIRPVSSLFFLSLKEFSLNSLVNLMMTSVILGTALWNYQGAVTAAGVIFYIMMLIQGAVLLYSIRMIGIIPVFWTFSSRGTEMLVWQLSRFMERPDRMFRGWVARILVSILPFSVIASYPARLFLDGFDWQIFLHLTVVTAVFFSLMYWFWHMGLRNYSSASS